MNKTAPALKGPSGSKAEPHINEGIDTLPKNIGMWQRSTSRKRSKPIRLAEAHYDLALSLDKSGDHKTAIEHFKKALELGKDNPDIQQSAILHAHLKKH